MIALFVCRYAALLRYAIDPSGAGKGLFFSYAADLTLTQQRYADLDASVKTKPLHARADQRFFFNRQLVTPLLGALHQFLHRYTSVASRTVSGCNLLQHVDLMSVTGAA